MGIANPQPCGAGLQIQHSEVPDYKSSTAQVDKLIGRFVETPTNQSTNLRQINSPHHSLLSPLFYLPGANGYIAIAAHAAFLVFHF